MEILFKHAWIMFIAVTVANGFVLKSRSKMYIAENPELETGYDKYFKGLLFYANIPWLIIAIGNISGMTNNFFDYFHPRSMNPMVLIFHASIIILWILSIYWIYFNDGAEFIERHPGLFNKTSLSGNTNVTAKQIKIFLPLMLLGGLSGMIMMWANFIPQLNF